MECLDIGWYLQSFRRMRLEHQNAWLALLKPPGIDGKGRALPIIAKAGYPPRELGEAQQYPCVPACDILRSHCPIQAMSERRATTACGNSFSPAILCPAKNYRHLPGPCYLSGSFLECLEHHDLQE
ncbi:hypothetical protein [Mesorhizobium sp. B3-1-9]|uniref:hypothetical protein n=1 Tax=Mesorhizobium sp. B3-1-9 TaxID=2589892 RepID=UPI001FEDE322|nr:hypothetical protein [Mesorhizobium sp. B3-1-9]